MVHDVAEIIKDQWPNALKKTMESVDAKFDLIMLALTKQTKSFNYLTKEVKELKAEQKSHRERILKLEVEFKLNSGQHKLNHPKHEA
jgi:hypothetical protein